MSSSSTLDRRAIEPYVREERTEHQGNGKLRGKFLRFLFRYPGELFAGTCAMGIATCATIAGPRIVGLIIDKALVAHDAGWFSVLLGILVSVQAVRLLASTAQAAIFGRLGQSLVHDLRSQLIDHIVHLKSEVIDSKSLGQIISRLTGDTAALAQVFTSAVVNIIEKLFVVVGIVLALIALDPALTVTALAVLPVLAISAWFASQAVYRGTAHVRRSTGGIVAFLSDSIGGIAVLRIFDKEQRQLDRFDLLNDELRTAQARPIFVNALFHPGVTLVNAAMIALLMVLGRGRVQSGELPIGSLIAFISYVVWFFWPIIHIANQWNILIAGFASAERVFEVFEWPRERHESAAPALTLAGGEIRFEGVWFAYRGEEWVLKDVSFTIPKGGKIGIVGATGSGKSTVLAILFRLYSPQRGRVLIDNVPLEDIPYQTLRRTIAIVQQDGALFEGSVRDNLTLSSEESDLSWAGARAEHLADRFVHDLSAGERQWISFMRAVARKPSIWCLDEAAAHLDPGLDAELHELVESQAHDSTLLIIAHRLSSVRKMNQILVMHQGRIVEQGSHAYLMDLNGLYARLVSLQNSVEREVQERVT